MKKQVMITMMMLSLHGAIAGKRSDMKHEIPVVDVMTKRASGYSFDATRSVSQEQMHSLMEAASLAPSSYNEQPWYFIVCDRTSNDASYDKTLSTLVEFNQNWAKNAPVLVIVVAASRSTHNNTLNRHAQYDTGAAAYGMMLQATSLGLMAHQMSGFDTEKLTKLFAIPADHVPMAVMAIGYPASTQETMPKKRKPLSENFFMGSWKQK